MFKSGGICYTKKKKRPGRAGNGVVIKMDLNRAALKADARRRAAGYRPSPILAALIVFALGLLISTLSSYLMGADRLTTALTNAAQFGPEAVEQAYISFFEHYSVSGVAVVLVIALEIMSYMVSVGFVIFSLHVSRDETAEIGNLFDGFGLFFRVLWLAILQGLLVFLWSLLLFVPGIIAAYRYSFAMLNLCENPELGVMEALNLSKRQTNGYKMQLFLLQLSFIGYQIAAVLIALLYEYVIISYLPDSLSGAVLGALIYGVLSAVVGVYLTPYLNLSTCRFYQLATAPQVNEPPHFDSWNDNF